MTIWSLVSSNINLQRWFQSVVVWVMVPFCLALFWYVLAYLTGGSSFVAKVWEENIARFAGSMLIPAHTHSIGYLIGGLLIGFMPWTLWSIPLCLAGRGGPAPEESKRYRRDRFSNFCLTAFLVIAIFYCLPASKRSVYLLAAYPFGAFLWVDFFWRVARGTTFKVLRGHSSLARLVVFICSVAVLIGVLGPYVWPVGWLPEGWVGVLVYLRYFVKRLEWWQWLVLVLSCQVLLVSSRAALSLQRALPLMLEPVVSSTYLAIILLGVGVVYPFVGREKGRVYFAEQVHNLTEPDTPLFSYGRKLYGVSLYSGRPMIEKRTPFFLGDKVVLPRKDLVEFQSGLSRNLNTKVVLRELTSFKPENGLLLLKVVSEKDFDSNLSGESEVPSTDSYRY